MVTDILKQLNKIANNSTQTKFAHQDTFVIHDYSEIKLLKDGWDQLYQNCEIPNLFTSYDWIKCIWDFNKTIGEPFIYVFHANNEIIAILPLLKQINNDKTIISLLYNPFAKTNDIIFDLKNLKLVSSWLIKVINNLDFTWDEIRLQNFTDNCFITKIINYIKKHSHLKFKVTTNNKVSYIPLKILANNWPSWQEQQSTASINAFKKLLDRYKDKYKIFVKTHHYTENNLLTTENIHHNLQSILDRKLKPKIVSTDQRAGAIDTFLQKFKDLDNYKHLLKYYHWYSNNENFATQYLIINNNNSYYIATEKLSGLEQSAKIYLQSLILKNCFDQNINKFYLGDDAYTWQKFWHLEYENIYDFTFYNS